MRILFPLFLTLIFVAGCSRAYLVQEGTWSQARQSGAPQDRIAVAAIPVRDGAAGERPIFVRYDRLSVQSGGPAGAVRVTAPNSRARRVTGLTLLTIGTVHLVAMGALLGYDLAPTSCPPSFVCDRIPISLFAGPPLAIIGLGLVIPGIVLTVQGFRHATEVAPSESGFLFIR